MRIDLLETLSHQVLDRWRERREAEPARPAVAADLGHGTMTWAQITEVVSSDPDWGAHLKAVPVRFEGTPPSAEALAGPEMRCYPPPGKQVSDYGVDQVVKVFHCSGASLVEEIV